MIECLCRHEDCDAIFTHHGQENETTCCPECGRQQMPQKATVSADITEVFLNAIASCPQNVREGFFAILRERWCIYCGAKGPTYQCYCHARGEDV